MGFIASETNWRFSWLRKLPTTAKIVAAREVEEAARSFDLPEPLQLSVAESPVTFFANSCRTTMPPGVLSAGGGCQPHPNRVVRCEPGQGGGHPAEQMRNPQVKNLIS